MKKVISVLIVGLMLLASANTVMAADDNLDIEKVAIQSLKNSQDIQSVNRQVALMQKYYADITAAANSTRNGLRYLNSYQAVEFIVLKPMEVQNSLTIFTNLQFVTTNAVRLSSYKAYIGLLKANYALTIQKGLMDSLDADYKKAQQQLSLGMISQSQLRLSEIAYLKSQYRYDSSQEGVNSASMSISNMMGEDLAKQYTLQDNNITPSAQIKSLNDYVNLALGNRAEIVNAQNTLDTKKKEFEYGKSEMPTDFQFYVQKQQYAIDSAQNDLDLAKMNVQLDITNNYKTLEYAMKTMETMKDLDDQATFNYQTAQVQYDNSQITLKDLGDAKVAKATADVNYKNAELDAWLAQTMMDRACSSGFQPANILSALSSSSSSSSSSKNNLNPPEKPDRGNSR